MTNYPADFDDFFMPAEERSRVLAYHDVSRLAREHDSREAFHRGQSNKLAAVGSVLLAIVLAAYLIWGR